MNTNHKYRGFFNEMTSIKNNDIPYLELDPDIKRQIEADRASGRIQPTRFDDADVIRRHDLSHDRATLSRPAFMRDVEKIVNVPAYNRYSGKTQVFSFVNNDDITRRGLHVQLVDRVARGIGRMLGLNTDLIEAISLGHDVGHTPFGHAGERFLSKCYHARCGRYFNHNVHSVRVLDALYPRNISLQTLDGVLAHNGEFACQTLKTGDIHSFDALDSTVEACIEDENAIRSLRPSTLEGCVVRISDMIAYIGKDRADALAMGVIDDIDVFDSSIIGKDNARIINNMTIDIINHSYGQDRISMSDEAFHDIKMAKRQNYEIIYSKEGMIDDTSNIVDEMFSEMYEKLLADLLAGDESSPVFRHHVSKLEQISHSMDAASYVNQDPDQVIVDYIASMTDDYFLSLYDSLFPNHGREIRMRGYLA